MRRRKIDLFDEENQFQEILETHTEIGKSQKPVEKLCKKLVWGRLLVCEKTGLFENKIYSERAILRNNRLKKLYVTFFWGAEEWLILSAGLSIKHT